MKKLFLSVFALVCVFLMSSCGGDPSYTSEEIFGKPSSEVEQNPKLLNGLMAVVLTDDGIRLSSSGPLMEGKVYVNAPDKKPEIGDEALIWRVDPNTYYIVFSENDGRARSRRAMETWTWCEENLK